MSGNSYDLYGGMPPHVDGDTSADAANRIRPAIETLQGQVLGFIEQEPRTCDEIEVLMEGRHQTISARVRELVLLKWIRDTGDRRKTRSGRNARVYEITPPDPIQVDTGTQLGLFEGAKCHPER